jgi:beta-galactosidase
MKFWSLFLLTVFSLSWQTQAQPESESARRRLSMDSGWKFTRQDSPDAKEVNFSDDSWRNVNLPHDWSIEGPLSQDAPAGGGGGYLPTGIGWYRKHFSFSPDEIENRRVVIQFDGVYQNSDVWINGHHLGHYPFGYGSFYYELTGHLVAGANVLAVRVDNSHQPNSRWYSGSGIYRHVWLIITEPLHIAHWGTYLTTPEVTTREATVKVQTVVQNDGENSAGGKLVTEIIDPDGNAVAKETTTLKIAAGDKATVDQLIHVPQPQLWDLDAPKLYRAISQVYDGEQKTDSVETTFGIRTIDYLIDKGFALNGRQVKMKGVCLHHDGGCVGAAVPERVWERRLEILKEMGCNAIRTSHNPPAPEFLDLCDRLGFLVMDEAFDEWKIGKTQHSYHEYFDEWAEHDLTSMIHRDRNHPSIVLWSVGNEIREQTAENGPKMLRALQDICHREDPTRPVTLGCDNIAADGGATAFDFLNTLDIVGYNYVDRWHERRELYYSLDKLANPGWKMIGTESVSAGGVRGGYSLGDDPNVVRPNYNYDMIRAEQLWKYEATRDYVIGDFMWTGIDYLGEAFWPMRSFFFGVLDLCGFPKDGFYFYQSQWTEKPMIHLFPHWNWAGREGQVIPVLCYSNCDAVELFLNGKSFGEKRLEFPRQGTSGGWNRYARPQIHPTTADLHLAWDVPYQPGTLNAVGKKNGEIVFEKEMKTAGAPAAIRLSVDCDTITADPGDVAHVTVEIVDSDGVVVPTADNLVRFSVEGDGRLLGVDNGNPWDHDSLQLPQRRAFNGLCLAIVQALKQPGDIRFAARADGLEEAVMDIQVQP